MALPVRKAVFPVAGLGTRFLPASKAVPKEMLTVVDEARAAGIEHFIFVTGRNKGAIEDHFDRQPELEQTLAARGKQAELEALIRDLPAPGETSFVRQQEPLGLGHAVWCALAKGWAGATACSPLTAWWRSRSQGPRPPTSPFSAAISCSLRSSTCSTPRRPGLAARSRSRTP